MYLLLNSFHQSFLPNKICWQHYYLLLLFETAYDGTTLKYQESHFSKIILNV